MEWCHRLIEPSSWFGTVFPRHIDTTLCDASFTTQAVEAVMDIVTDEGQIQSLRQMEALYCSTTPGDYLAESVGSWRDEVRQMGSRSVYADSAVRVEPSSPREIRYRHSPWHGSDASEVSISFSALSTSLLRAC